MLHPLIRLTFSPHNFYGLRSQSRQFSQTSIIKRLDKMPRDKKHLEEIQKQRLRNKEKNSKYSPGIVNLQVLGSGAPGSPASVYLFTDQTRYLFNCGEGTQRLAHEHKIKLTRLEHIFITRTSWDHVGGLPGLSLTVQDAGVPNLSLHGPSGLDEIFCGMRKFVVLKHLHVDYINCENSGKFEDQVMDVTYVPLKKKENFVNMFQGTSGLATPHIKKTNHTSERNHAAGTGSSDTVISYICKLKPKPGVLNLEKCVELGVPPGPLLGHLKNGLDITLEDGTKIYADEVRGPDDPGPVFIFIDIPNQGFLSDLENSNKIFEKYQASSKDPSNIASVVIHFSPQEILETESYQQFINKFSPSTKHLVLNSTNKFSGYSAAHRIQWQLNLLHRNIFPVLKENDVSVGINGHKKARLSSVDFMFLEKANQNNNDISYVDPVSSLTYFHLRPRKGLDRSMESKLTPDEYINETKAIEGFSQSLSELRENLHQTALDKRSNTKYEIPKLIFLGTGSCIPNKTRNVSAVLLQTSEHSYILLDCGEGTWGQVIRFFGQEAALRVLRDIKAVYISHLHADHHIGLLGILKAREEMLEPLEPLILFAPKQIQPWLSFYDNKIESIQRNFTLIPNGDLLTQPLTNPDLTSIGIFAIRTCLVRHCPNAFGVSLELHKTLKNERIKITYSGDTMPCDDLVSLGMNTTILIHEATMEDDLIHEAKLKMHSTVSQAVEQGLKMNAQFTILTHFSQRYAKIPRIEDDLARNIGIAFDNMELTLYDLNYLHLIYPTLKILFSEHCDEMEQKAVKRALKRTRKSSLEE